MVGVTTPLEWVQERTEDKLETTGIKKPGALLQIGRERNWVMRPRKFVCLFVFLS